MGGFDGQAAGLAATIKGARAAAGWTQEHLGQAARVSAKTIKRIEAGHTVSADSLRDVCAALGLDYRKLRGDGAATTAAAAQLRLPRPPYVHIVEADGPTVLTEDAACTVLRVEGTVAPLAPSGLERLAADLHSGLSAHFCRRGHAVQMWFGTDPVAGRQRLGTMTGRARTAARRLGLDLDDLLAAREAALAPLLTRDDFFIVLWTTPAACVHVPRWTMVADGRAPAEAVVPVRARHETFVAAFLADIARAGVRVRALDGAEAVAAIRASLDPCGAPSADGMKADGDSPEFPRPDFVDGVVDGVVTVGASAFAALDMVIGPQEVLPFAALAGRLMRDGLMPWRMSFLMEDGEATGQWGDGQGRSGPLGVNVKLRVSFATWSDAESPEVVRERVRALRQAVEAWGYCAVAPAADPVAGMYASALALDVASTAPAALAPLKEVFQMLPWDRPSSPQASCVVPLRRPWGGLWPHHALRLSGLELVSAPPGYGKTCLLNAQTFGYCLEGSGFCRDGRGERLPRVGVVDVGPASAGLASLLRWALPPARRHEVAYVRLRPSKEHAVNPFDTQLGCRAPTPLDRAFLVNFVTLLATPFGDDRPPDGMADLAGAAVDELYERFSDRSKRGNPRPYADGDEPLVDEALRRHAIPLSAEPTWWEVVDKLFQRNARREAALAQRHAVPRVEDLMVIRSLQIMDAYGSAKTANGEPLIDVFQRSIAALLRECPNLTVPTRLDLDDARVRVVDIDEAAPRGGPAADRKTAIAYMLARWVAGRDLYADHGDVYHAPDDYRSHHEARIAEIRAVPRRLVLDEAHRVMRTPAVRDQVLIDARNALPRGLNLVVASQLPEDFGGLVEAAEEVVVWVLGAGSDRQARQLGAIFGLDAAAWANALPHLRGPGPGGVPLYLHVRGGSGVQEHPLVLSFSPTDLWAFSSAADDSALREALVQRMGNHAAALRRLAKRFPHGSAVRQIEQRIASGLATDGAAAVAQLVEEMTQGAVDD